MTTMPRKRSTLTLSPPAALGSGLMTSSFRVLQAPARRYLRSSHSTAPCSKCKFVAPPAEREICAREAYAECCIHRVAVKPSQPSRRFVRIVHEGPSPRSAATAFLPQSGGNLLGYQALDFVPGLLGLFRDAEPHRKSG